MNSKIRVGLSFGVGMTIFFILQGVLSNDAPNNTNEILKLIVSSLLGGLFSGFLFGWIIWKFNDSKSVKAATKIDMDTNEKLVFQTGANHFKGIEGVGGRLYLTDKRLIFNSHKLNFQNHQLIIELSEIASAGKFKPFGIANNGLSIQTKKHATEKFVVDRIDKWLLCLK
jgi:hypothetical protein